MPHLSGPEVGCQREGKDVVRSDHLLELRGPGRALQVGAVRVGKLEGNFVVNPSEPDIPECELDLIVAGTDEAILMVEASAFEVTEAEILDALDIAHQEIKKLCAAQRELAELVGKEKLQVEAPQVEPELYGLGRFVGPAFAASSTRCPQTNRPLCIIS